MAVKGQKLPSGFSKKLKELVRELEDEESAMRDRAELGEIELKINEAEALWYVAYKTLAQ